MQTLYDRYVPDAPSSAVEILCRDDSTGRTSLCESISSGEEGNVQLYLFDLLTGQRSDRYVAREKLRTFKLIKSKDLNKEETRALERRARFDEDRYRALSKLFQDPDAGKGSEHFW